MKDYRNHPPPPSPSARPPSLVSSSTSRPSSVFSTSSTTSSSSFPLLPPPHISIQSSLTPPNTPGISRVPSLPFPKRSSSPSLAFPNTPEGGAPLINPRHALMRSRRVSMPASLVQTNAAVTNKNRMSVASVASFESLPEEEDDPLPGRPALARRSASPHLPPERKTSSASLSPIKTRSSSQQRYSLPTPPAYGGGFQAFALPGAGRTSSLGRPIEYREEEKETEEDKEERRRERREMGEQKRSSKELWGLEKSKREERRWRIALEMRETERTYVAVLEEIDKHYYQPLLNVLSLSDTGGRRTPARTDSYGSPPTSPILSYGSPPTSPILSPTSLTDSRSRTSTFDSLASSTTTTTSATTTTAASSTSSSSTPLPPTQVLSRKEISEIFSNFPAVLSLSHVMLSTLDSAIPDRPSDPVAVPPALLSPTSPLEPELSSSADTEASGSEPGTPVEGESVEEARRRTTSIGRKDRKAPALPFALGKALLPILPFLKSYSLFVSNFSAALSRLAGLETPVGASGISAVEDRVRWQSFCEERRKAGAGRGLGLGGLLLNIVQRVPRYRFLLADMITFTEKDHPDFGDLKRAFDVVDQVASHLESQIRAHTQVLQILDLQRSFINLDAPLLAPGRRLVKAGGLRKLDRRGNDQMRTFFLFNDIFIHASGGESGSWGGLSGTEALESRARNQPSGTAATSQAGGPAQYCFHRRFALEGITVVDVQDATEQGRRYGFEILSSEKSFAVYAETLTEKLDWIDEIRGAIAELMSDRRTLQREADSEALRRDRRISLPASPSAPNLRPLAFRTQTTPLPPALGFIPPTPLDERDGLLADSPGVFDQAFEFPTQGVDLDSPTLESDGRTRRCSDMAPSTAARALSEALPAETEEPVVEYRVIENYSAPVWVPDSKADRCMCCSSQFGVLRRRHHCRLCGAVVCWSCSTKSFIIPSNDEGGADRLARSCDRCCQTVFGTSSEPSPSTSTSNEHSRADIDSPEFGPRGEQGIDLPMPGFRLDAGPQLAEEGRAPTAVAKLASLLSRTSLHGQV